MRASRMEFNKNITWSNVKCLPKLYSLLCVDLRVEIPSDVTYYVP